MAKRNTGKSISLSGFYVHSDLDQCLQIIQRENVRVDSRDGVVPLNQKRIFDDLRHPLDERALAEMMNYWEFDNEELRRRGRADSSQKPAKPQIDVELTLSSAGNFKALWEPRERLCLGPSGHQIRTTDFHGFKVITHRQGKPDARPSNQLLFIHDVSHALVSLAECSRGLDQITSVSMVLLQACASSVALLKERLDYHFDVRMTSDVFIEWAAQERTGGRPWPRTPARMISWTLDDPQARLAAAEMKTLATSDRTFGFPIAALLTTWRYQLTRQPKTGRRTSPHTLFRRIAQSLTEQGYPTASGTVERAVRLLERYRPEDCPNLE